jgi:microcystin-dependent protein
MPRPTTPTLAPYAEQLPDVNDQSTWATRTPLFWNWVTGPGYDNLSSLLGYSESAIDFVDGALAGSETVVDAVADLQTEMARMAGMIVMWSGAVANVPTGWALCNGANGTPDLRDRFVVGAGSAYAPGATGGADTVALTTAQMPAHAHGVNINTNSAGAHTHGIRSDHSTDRPILPRNGSFGLLNDGAVGAPGQTNAAGSHAHNVSGNTASVGSSAAHENRPPYYALAYIMKL